MQLMHLCIWALFCTLKSWRWKALLQELSAVFWYFTLLISVAVQWCGWAFYVYKPNVHSFLSFCSVFLSCTGGEGCQVFFHQNQSQGYLNMHTSSITHVQLKVLSHPRGWLEWAWKCFIIIAALVMRKCSGIMHLSWVFFLKSTIKHRD